MRLRVEAMRPDDIPAVQTIERASFTPPKINRKAATRFFKSCASTVHRVCDQVAGGM